MASTMMVVSGLIASVVGGAVHSVIFGLVAYAIVLSVFGTAFVLRAASRASARLGNRQAGTGATPLLLWAEAVSQTRQVVTGRVTV
jgi:hypothetical protein